MIMALVFMLGVLTGCGSVTPEECAENYIKGAMAFDYNKLDKYSVVSSRVIIEATINSYAERLDLTIEEIINKLADGYDFEASSIDGFMRGFKKYTQQQIEEKYGKDYLDNVKVSIVNSQEMDEDKIAKILKEASDYYDNHGIIVSDLCDFSKIKKCNKVSLKIYSKDAKGKQDVDEGSLYVVLVNGKWRVLNLGVGEY